MAPQLLSKAPQCISCIRRVARLGNAIAFPAGQQIRGKRKLAKIPTVDVQLLQNVPGYGRKGSIVPVTRGIMRNTWFPKKMADYAPATKLEELAKENIMPERDPTFGSKKARKAAIAAQPPPAPKVEAEVQEEVVGRVELPLLSPLEATDVISKLLPANVDFYRTLIAPETPKHEPLKRVSPSIPASSAISAAAAAAAADAQPREGKPVKQAQTGIYGSVSTSDIAVNLQAVLAETSGGASIVLSPENISFVEQVEDRNRVKCLGTYEIEIRLSGGVKAIRRTITINAQE